MQPSHFPRIRHFDPIDRLRPTTLELGAFYSFEMLGSITITLVERNARLVGVEDTLKARGAAKGRPSLPGA